MTRTEALSHFLDALDAWGCEDNDLRAKEIVEFLDGGCDLSEYEDRTELRVIQGGRAQEGSRLSLASEESAE